MMIIAACWSLDLDPTSKFLEVFNTNKEEVESDGDEEPVKLDADEEAVQSDGNEEPVQSDGDEEVNSERGEDVKYDGDEEAESERGEDVKSKLEETELEENEEDGQQKGRLNHTTKDKLKRRSMREKARKANDVHKQNEKLKDVIKWLICRHIDVSKLNRLIKDFNLKRESFNKKWHGSGFTFQSLKSNIWRKKDTHHPYSKFGDYLASSSSRKSSNSKARSSEPSKRLRDKKYDRKMQDLPKQRLQWQSKVSQNLKNTTSISRADEQTQRKYDDYEILMRHIDKIFIEETKADQHRAAQKVKKKIEFTKMLIKKSNRKEDHDELKKLKSQLEAAKNLYSQRIFRQK